MRDNNNYEMPKSRKDKIEFLKALSKGQKKIDDIMEPTFKVTLWIPAGDQLRNQHGDIIPADRLYDEKKRDRNTMYVTLNID